ncbi:TPA: YadA C-terminal domain-containing protein [Yersinia enterocolitica]|uniref:YadA C-terminal domain-containing protein n=1 Tax=Yersinia enterocolitica TaxID=630 RepID=UPI0032F37F93|nr:YadA C-terminal domain-containing protein [Yersinia enterocolitica]HDL7432791.1 YadA C-terminal domain-containing protein [Yersinia enterocolitica]HDL7471157.1 YadA C-terminal domain-containing protein [Yersinia enterocolitica]HDL7474774.1 YadA C-terminal domain-containing protein [Yersinia enterocolitica]HDL7491479.1 YadA C-terminal domain-containing protein [Yersinia enterocolitica]
MKRSKLALVIALSSIFSTTADAKLIAPTDADGYNQVWGEEVIDRIEQTQQLADKTNILANDNAGRIQLLEDEPKPMDGKNGLDGTNGTNGKDGADGKDGQNGANGKDGAVGATGAAGLNGTDHHNDAVVQKNTTAVSQNTQRLSNQEMRISTLASQDNQEFANLKAEVDNNQSRSDAGIAGVAAMANIPQVQESQQFAMGAGVGGYGSENAVAVGASFHATQNTIVKLTVSNDTQHNFGWGAGTSYGW